MERGPGGGAITAGGSAIRIVRYAAEERHPFHAHDRSCVTLVLSGALEERVGPDLERGAPLSVVIKPAGTLHADRFGARGATTLQIEFSPRDEPGAGPAREALGCWRWVHASEAARPMLGMVDHLRNRAGAHPSGVATCLDELLIETLAVLDPPIRRPSSAPPAWLTRVREVLVGRSASIRDLSSQAGVHPIHLAREFRRYFGIAPTRFRGRMRIWRAAGLLSGARDPLVSVALEAGFTDQAHMSRVFRHATGHTPLAMRRLTRPTGTAH